jgi:hypothetical protein
MKTCELKTYIKSQFLKRYGPYPITNIKWHKDMHGFNITVNNHTKFFSPQDLGIDNFRFAVYKSRMSALSGGVGSSTSDSILNFLQEQDKKA